MVGPQIALRSLPATGGPTRVDFEVVQPGGVELGRIETELVKGSIVVRCAFEPAVGPDLQVQAIRLVVRVVCKLAAVPIVVHAGSLPDGAARPLTQDGLQPGEPNCWRLATGSSILSAAKSRDMRELYEDPYRVVWNFEPRPWPMLASFLSDAAPLPDRRVLDVGCGFAKNTVLLEGLGFEAYGIDVAEGAVSLGQRWMRHPDRLQAASITELPFGDADFGWVLDVGCLHCLPSDLLDPAIAELARVLRPGGRIYSRVFKPRDPHWLAAQNYEAKAMGHSDTRLVEMFTPWFEVATQDMGEATLVRGIRRRD